MKLEKTREALERLDGPNHHDRDAQLARNGRWGTCGYCPSVEGVVYPERCKHTARYDHNLKRENHDAWAEIEQAESLLRDAATLRVFAVAGLSAFHGRLCLMAGRGIPTPDDATKCQDPKCRAWAAALAKEEA